MSRLWSGTKRSAWLRRWSQACAVLAAIAGSTVQAQVFFTENFDGVTLGPIVDEQIPNDDPREAVWSPTGPTGWVSDRSGTPTGGMTEWRGWNFVDPLWWSERAGDQGRGAFALGGVIAVADGDEWMDGFPAPTGPMNAILRTPSIPLAGVASGTQLQFDSSWLPEDDQRAWLTASFDGGAPVEVFNWTSNSADPDYKADANPESVSVPITIPAGAQNVVFGFGYDGVDDWWWAIDNIQFGNFSEDFDSVELGENVMEGRATGLPYNPDKAFTHTGPTGWKTENDIAGYDEEGVGVTEWKGWSFTDKTFWQVIAGDQRRSEFTLGSGNVAVADPDEWDDLGNPKSLGLFNTIMSTPTIDISTAAAGKLELSFDSSWRPECCDDGDNTNNQTAVITVSYDGGPEVEVMRWQSDEGSEFYHDHNPNEAVKLALQNPSGAKNAVFHFGLLNSANDWWWAIDNLKLSAAGGVAVAGDFDGNGVLDAADINALSGQVRAGSNNKTYDVNNDNVVNEADREVWVNQLKKTYFGDANLDGEFNTTDFVSVFQAGEYEDAAVGNSKWETGDWNGDAEFNTGDFITAFQAGGFEAGPRAAVSAVPEPATGSLLFLAGLAALRRRARK